jgi:hypothetical protein
MDGRSLRGKHASRAEPLTPSVDESEAAGRKRRHLGGTSMKVFAAEEDLA